MGVILSLRMDFMNLCTGYRKEERETEKEREREREGEREADRERG